MFFFMTFVLSHAELRMERQGQNGNCPGPGPGKNRKYRSYICFMNFIYYLQYYVHMVLSILSGRARLAVHLYSMGRHVQCTELCTRCNVTLLTATEDSKLPRSRCNSLSQNSSDLLLPAPEGMST